MFKNYPADAVNLSRPTEVPRKRVLLALSELGLSFVPLSVTLKDMATNFIRSFYYNQRITEGALFGYYESMGNQKGMSTISKQYMNPFEVGLKL